MSTFCIGCQHIGKAKDINNGIFSRHDMIFSKDISKIFLKFESVLHISFENKKGRLENFLSGRPCRLEKQVYALIFPRASVWPPLSEARQPTEQ